VELGSVDLKNAITAARSFLRPIGWRGACPEEAGLEGCLVFGRDKRVTSFDGTEIAYSVFGERGPWVALVPGFCCPDNFWRYLLPPLARRFRVIIYDLRGLGLSGFPRAPGYRAMNLSVDDFTIENHARDLMAILDQEDVDRAALIGHSMGGQIILEAYRHFPDRVSALCLLTAPFESPTRTLYGRDLDVLLRLIKTSVGLLPRPMILLWRALFVARPDLTHRGAQLVRALGPSAKVEDMATYYRHMAFLDPLILFKMADAMRAHSARDVLPTITVPTLVVAGSLDPFTPVALARTMRDEIPNAELIVLEDASHGAVIEKPDDVNFAVTSFLERSLAPPSESPSGDGDGAGPARVSAGRRSPATPG
jgi:pimeloyl-ACP methyl ester carboxylesterase